MSLQVHEADALGNCHPCPGREGPPAVDSHSRRLPPWEETVEETATHVILIVLPWARIFPVLVTWELFAIWSSVEEVLAVGIPE